MAQAQREETEQFFRHQSSIRAGAGWPALAILVALLGLAHLATLICWARPVQVDAKAKKIHAVVDGEKARPDGADGQH